MFRIKTSFIMFLWKPSQVLLILKTLSIKVRCETEVITEQTREGVLTEGTSDNRTMVGIQCRLRHPKRAKHDQFRSPS